MRNLARVLVLWLCDRFDITLVDETRIRNGADAVERGQRWEQFAREKGGLFDMLDAMRREAFEAYGDLPAHASDERLMLAITDRDLRQLRKRVEGIVANGKITAERLRAAERMNVAQLRR